MSGAVSRTGSSGVNAPVPAAQAYGRFPPAGDVLEVATGHVRSPSTSDLAG